MSQRSDLDVNSSLSSSGPGSQVASESDKKEPDKTRDIAEDFERVISLEQPLQSQIDNGDELSCSSSETKSVKYVRGVAVQLGKTRTLVECWERREKSSSGNVAIVSS
ncbi:uncharacterized protein LOC141837917 [Curcuma longa]|uniref:uncharacterized protein LOC141837836 n=1 Tax=Curcuma longa TaxID=136217 RepID=UPI003D9E85F2